MGEFANGRLLYFPSTTREETEHMGRITTLIETGELFEALKIAPLNAETDRVMVCASMAFMKDIRTIVDARGFHEGSNADPGTYVVERAFVG